MNKRTNRKQQKATEPDLAAYRSLVNRLPVTLRPALNQQLSAWEMLFPFERCRASGFLNAIGSLSPSAFDALTAPLWKLERKMGVAGWNFSEARDTMENASLLARSEYYAEWRSEVERFFEAANAAQRDSVPNRPSRTRFVIQFLPSNLPVDPLTAWQQWDPRGRAIAISGDSRRLCELVMQGQPGLTGITVSSGQQGGADNSDLWFIDAEEKLGSTLSTQPPMAWSALSFATLKPFRDRFLAELNTIPRDIQESDAIMDELRRENWDRWWPAEYAGQPRLCNFIIDLFLSGNGAIIFSNAFVEWAASEVLRRARPRGVVARFGMRSKPKLFTGIAIFENQQTISPIPDVDDPQGSAIDAVILARYIWEAALRYPEGEQTFGLCVAEHNHSAYMIPPAGKDFSWSAQRSMTPEEVYSWVRAQFDS
jgi:hypothetical protein